jgi:hypothetical protein
LNLQVGRCYISTHESYVLVVSIYAFILQEEKEVNIHELGIGLQMSAAMHENFKR